MANLDETLKLMTIEAGGPGSGRKPTGKNMEKYHSVLTNHGFNYQGKDPYGSGVHVYSKGKDRNTVQKGSQAVLVHPSNNSWTHDTGKDPGEVWGKSPAALDRHLSNKGGQL